MDPSSLIRLGNPLWDSSELDPKSDGLGLGLSIVRRTAEMLGHRLVVRSVLGRGSCFGVVLARARGGDLERRAG